MTYSVIPKRFSVSQETSTDVGASEPQSFQETTESTEKQSRQRAMETEFDAFEVES